MKSRYAVVLFMTLFSISGSLLAQSEIEADAAKQREVSTTYMLEGVVEAEQKTTISAQTAGVIKAIRFDVDDVVQKDELVIQIDDKQQQAALKQAQAAEKEARARLQEAQSEYNRVEEVFKKQVVSKSAFDKANAALKAARARLESSQASVVSSKEQLTYTRVRAPFSGIMTKRLVEVGETVNVGTPLVSGISLERLRVATHVPQSIIDEVRDHRYAIVVTEDAEIVSTDMTFFPYADPLSHSFQLRVHLPQGESGLLPGMFVKVAMEVNREEKTVIPFNSVAFRSEVTGVYVQQGSTLTFRHIRLGRRLGNNEVVVVSGVHAGEMIVTDPVAAAIAIKAEKAE